MGRVFCYFALLCAWLSRHYYFACASFIIIIFIFFVCVHACVCVCGFFFLSISVYSLPCRWSINHGCTSGFCLVYKTDVSLLDSLSANKRSLSLSVLLFSLLTHQFFCLLYRQQVLNLSSDPYVARPFSFSSPRSIWLYISLQQICTRGKVKFSIKGIHYTILLKWASARQIPSISVHFLKETKVSFIF